MCVDKKKLVYEHSGEAPLSGMLLSLAIGGIFAFVFSFGYAYLLSLIYYHQIGILFAMILGVIVGFSAGYGVKLGKIRNSRAAGILGIFTGVIAVYFSWVWLVYIFSEYTYVSLSPSNLTEYIHSIIQNYNNIISSLPPYINTFIFLGLQAFGIMLLSYTVTPLLISDSIFCENCNRWLSPEKMFVGLQWTPDIDMLKTQLGQGDLEILKSLPGAEENDEKNILLQFTRCSKCQQTNYMSVKLLDKKAGLEDIDSNLKVTKKDYDFFKQVVAPPEKS